MRRFAVLVLLTVMPCSCSGGGGGDGRLLTIDPSPVRQGLAECTALGVRDFSKLAEGILWLVGAINDPAAPPVRAAYDPTVGFYALQLDLDLNGSPDTFLGGGLTPVPDLSDGFDHGESFIMPLASTGLVSFTGQLMVTFAGSPSDPNYTVEGDLVAVDGSPCTFEANSINVTTFFFLGEFAGNGVVDFTVTNAGNQLGGIASFTPDEDVVVNGTDANGQMMFFVDAVSFVPYVR